MGLIHTHGRVVIEVNMEYKNSHTFENGTTIRLEREYGNLNNREVKPTNAIVVSAENIPSGVEVLVHHNSTHATNQIFDYKSKSPDIKYFSIPESDCYAWRNSDGELKPLKGFAFALRVFKPYFGVIEGIEHEKLKDVLYLQTGKLKGCVVHCLKAADYQLVFQDNNGREGNIIRIRHSDDEEIDREEVVAINHSLTEKVNNGSLWVGLSTTDAKPLIHYEIKSNVT